jgi:ribonuclease P protein component
MLPKPHRLPGYRIPEIIKSRTRFHSELATLILSPTSGDETSRFTVIVPVKLSKKAVPRNRTKRLLREALYQNLPQLPQGTDGILLAKKLLVEEKLQDILSDIMTLLEKAHLLTHHIT